MEQPVKAKVTKKVKPIKKKKLQVLIRMLTLHQCHLTAHPWVLEAKKYNHQAL